MSLSDPIGDMLTHIRNGQRALKSVATSPASKLKERVLEVLKKEGYIRDYSQVEQRKGVSNLRIELKYFEGNPVIREIKRISKPGRRVYFKVKSLPRVYSGLGVLIVSTPMGVMSDSEAREQNLGGEALCHVF